MADCRCLVAITMIHIICLQLLSTTESVDVHPSGQLLPVSDLTSRWPSVYAPRDLRNGKYMRFGRASSRLPEALLDDSDLLLGGRDQRERSQLSEYRFLIDNLLRRLMAQSGNDAKAWTASGESEKGES